MSFLIIQKKHPLRMHMHLHRKNVNWIVLFILTQNCSENKKNLISSFFYFRKTVIYLYGKVLSDNEFKSLRKNYDGYVG